MNAAVQKWGNSLALRIPSALAKDIHFHQGSVVEVDIIEGNMVVKPLGQHKYSLSRMLKSITSKNIHAEHDWGGATGREVL